jgi:hypothetical protein
MRDYAELGRRRTRGQRTAQHTAQQDGGFAEAGPLTKAWGVWSSAGVTLGLSAVLAVALLMQALGGGAGNGLWGAGVGPLMLRLVLVLLTVNLIAVTIEKAGAWRAGQTTGGLEVAKIINTHDALWDETLSKAGAHNIHRDNTPHTHKGQRLRRWWAHRNALLAGTGTLLLHAAGLALLWQHALAVDDPPLAEMTLIEGQPVEAWSLPDTAQSQGLSSALVTRNPLRVFSGYEFDIERAEQLRPLLGKDQRVPHGDPAVLVMRRAGETGDGQRIAFDPQGRITLSDDTVFRIKRVRNDLRPASATFGISLPDGQMFVRRVGRGHTLNWPGGPSLSVVELEVDRRGQGPAVKFLPLGSVMGGDVSEGFWMYAQAPELVSQRLPEGASIELHELHNGLVVTLEMVPPQHNLLPALGVALLLLGGTLMLAKPSTTLTLRDEGDRIVLEGGSLNDISGLPERLQAMAAFCVSENTSPKPTGDAHDR